MVNKSLTFVGTKDDEGNLLSTLNATKNGNGNSCLHLNRDYILLRIMGKIFTFCVYTSHSYPGNQEMGVRNAIFFDFYHGTMSLDELMAPDPAEAFDMEMGGMLRGCKPPIDLENHIG